MADSESLSIPQEIIDTIIGAIDVHDKALLKKCASISHSFLHPSRKRLYSFICLSGVEDCQRLCRMDVQTQYLQMFVKTLHITDNLKSIFYDDSEPLLPILRLPLHRLETFLVTTAGYHIHWDSLTNNMRNALRNIIHSSPLTSLTLRFILEVPVDLFLGLARLQMLDLDNIFLDILNMPSHGHVRQIDSELSEGTIKTTCGIAVEQFRWAFPTGLGVFDLSKSKCLPFLSHPRFVELDIIPVDSIKEFHFLLHTLVISIQCPATLEHLKCRIGFHWSNVYKFMQHSIALDAWTQLDSLITLPTCSRLERVDLNICLRVVEDGVGLEAVNQTRDMVRNLIPQTFPSLLTKGILLWDVSVKHGSG